MSLIIYGDFGCPECALAARRADVLAAAGVPVDWRAVEHRPHVPVTGRPLDAGDQHVLAARLTALDDLLLPGERRPERVPSFAPRTEAAVSAYAEAYGTPVADDVRRLLIDLYWTSGADIGSPTVLRTALAGAMLRARATAEPVRQCGLAVSPDRGPITTTAYRRRRAWRDEWNYFGRPPLPLVLAGGATLHGVDALKRLGKEIVYTGAPIAPVLPDPRRYPEVAVHPARTWTSWVGGRWATVHRAG